MNAPRGIPGAQRIDHLALTVTSLDQAIDFVVNVLGGDLVYRLPPLTRSDTWMRDHLDVHPRSRAEIALLRVGPVTNLELFEYDAPDQRSSPPRPCDVGSQRLGLLVDDVDVATTALGALAGMTSSGPARTSPPDSPRAGTRWAPFVTPWGMALELRSVPAVLPYERHTSARRFGPCTRWAGGAAGRPSPVPGLRNVDHVAYTVADLDAALAVFVEVLGGELLYRTVERDMPSATAGDAVEHAALRMGPTDNVELYAYPSAGGRPPRNSDVGGRHLAVHVRDVDAAAAYLGGQPGFRVLGAPETIDAGPIAGDRWVYVRSPLGLHIELVHMPDGSLPYERGTAARRRAAGALSWADR